MSCSVTLKQVGYERNNHALFEAVNLNIGHQEKVAILGSNGVGKSTLLKIIAGLQSEFNGSLELFHNPIKSKKDYQPYRMQVGYLPQDVSDFFLSITVIEDVMFNLRVQGIEQDEAYTKAVEMLESLKSLHLKDRIISELSGGEQKLVALASILITKPKILLLDEPTNALDQASQQRMIEVLGELDQSMVIVSHHQEFIEALNPTMYELGAAGLRKL